MFRREFLLTLATAAASAYAQTPASGPVARKGRLKQAVTRGVFAREMSLEDCCREAARLGVKGFDLIGPNDWPTIKKYGLIPTMYQGPGGSIPDALNRKENHDKIEKDMHAGIDLAASNGVPNMITFSGNRRGMADPEGADNCV